LFYAALFHFAAGVVTGSAYRVYVLLALLVLVAVESGVALVIYGSGEVWWALANPALLQMGYLVGALGRDLYEASPYSHRAMRPMARIARLFRVTRSAAKNDPNH